MNEPKTYRLLASIFSAYDTMKANTRVTIKRMSDDGFCDVEDERGVTIKGVAVAKLRLDVSLPRGSEFHRRSLQSGTGYLA